MLQKRTKLLGHGRILQHDLSNIERILELEVGKLKASSGLKQVNYCNQ
jgi:hypothetical protein